MSNESPASYDVSRSMPRAALHGMSALAVVFACSCASSGGGGGVTSPPGGDDDSGASSSGSGSSSGGSASGSGSSSGGSASGSGSSSGGSASGSGSSSGGSSGDDDASPGGNGSDSGSSGDAAAPVVPGAPDPALTGPYTYAELDDTATVAATGDKSAIHCAYPTAGPTAGPYPIVVFAHGFQIAPSEYVVYLQHLASFGYVALTADFPTSLLGNVNPTEAKDLAAALDWAVAKGGVLANKVDITKAGISGHSLGGKLALLTASTDSRFKASLVLDPVDGGGPTGCTSPNCVLVSSLLPTLTIPVGYLGETTDATASGQACAPAAFDYETLYKVTPSPSFAVTVTGANHMSFIMSPSACGLTCSLCNKATAAQDSVLSMAQAYLVAFYERHLRGTTAYDAWLTGAAAETRYVQTSQATIETK